MGDIVIEFFTEGETYVIKGGKYLLRGVTKDSLVFERTNLEGKKITAAQLRSQMSSLMDRLLVEEKCAKRKRPCGKLECGICHPENFE